MHSGASKAEINTTFCILAGRRVHISQCMCGCLIGEGGWWWWWWGRQKERGERRKREEEAERGRKGVGTALQRVAEHWVSVQLAQASTPPPVGCFSMCVCVFVSMSTYEPVCIHVYKCSYALAVCINTTKPHTYGEEFSIQYGERWQ